MKTKNLGILIVHGIGEQPRGDTLVRFGDPLLRWLQRRIEPYGKVELKKAYTADQDPDSKGPAHVIASLKLKSNSKELSQSRERDNLEILGPPNIDAALRVLDKVVDEVEVSKRGRRPPSSRGQTWVVAESWWAQSFQRPAFGPFARWLLSRGPWVIISQFGDHLREAEGWRRVPALIALLLSLLLALIAQIVVAALAILAIVPWPALRSSLSGVLLTLTGTLGDSYVFAESEVQETAAVTRVKRDLTWLAGECDSVVVIAHSQGAAIARQAIQSFDKPVALFVTLGEGIKRLEKLRWMTNNWQGLFSALAFLLPIVTLSAIASFFPPSGFSSEDLSFFRWALVGYPATFLLFSLLSQPDYREKLHELGLRAKLRWVDFFASADLVPNGPLDIPNVEPKPVYNLASLTRDHTTYLRNPDQVISPLLIEIDKAAGTQLFMDAELVNAVGSKRPRRVQALVLARWSHGLSALVAVAAYGLRGNLAAIGDSTLNLWASVPLIGSLATSIRRTAGAVERLFINAQDATGAITVGIALIGLVTLAWYGLTRRLWQTWDELAIRPLFRRISKGDYNEQRVVGVLVGLFASVPVLAAMSSLSGWTMGALGRSALFALWWVPVVFAVVGFLMLVFFAIKGLRKR